MQTTIDTRFFRAGVGTVIYNQNNQVLLFKRAKHPVGVWQFQQGGIDLGEDIESTLWRELKEEVGLTQNDIAQVDEMPHWTVHPAQSSLDDHEKSRLGQAHKWYFLQLKPDVTIDLTLATDQEASDYCFTDFPAAIDECEELKKPVYQALHTHFTHHINPQL